MDGRLDTFGTSLDDTIDLAAAVKLSASDSADWSGSLTAWESPHLPVRFLLGGAPIVSEVFVDLFFTAHAEASAEASYEIGKTCTRTATAPHSKRSGTSTGSGPSASPSNEASERRSRRAPRRLTTLQK